MIAKLLAAHLWRLVAGVLALALGVVVAFAAHRIGLREGTLACQASTATKVLSTTARAAQQARQVTTQRLQRAQAAGLAREADSVAIDAFFNRLESEAIHGFDYSAPAPAGDDAACRLSDFGLRRWAAANAGPFADAAPAGSAASKPLDGPAPASAAEIGADARPRGEPPGGGPGLPPTGQPLLPDAAVPGPAG